MNETGEQRSRLGFLREVGARVMDFTDRAANRIFGISEESMYSALERLKSHPVEGAVDVVPTNRLVEQVEPVIHNLEEVGERLGGEEYEQTLGQANNAQEIAVQVAPQMHNLANLRQQADQIEARIKHDAGNVIKSVSGLTGLDMLESVILSSNTEDAQRITDQYQAQVSGLVQAAINNTIEHSIQDALEGAPYPTAITLSKGQIAQVASHFVDKVWTLITEPEAPDDTTQATDQPKSPAPTQVAGEAQLDPQSAISVDNKNDVDDRDESTKENTEGGSADLRPEDKLGELIDKLEIDQEMRKRIRIEIAHILNQYIAALRPDPVEALIHATSVAPMVQERIAEARSSIANVPAVVETGNKVADLLERLRQMQDADPEMRKKIATPALGRINELLRNPTGLDDALNELQSLLQEYIHDPLTDKRAQEILENIERIATKQPKVEVVLEPPADATKQENSGEVPAEGTAPPNGGQSSNATQQPGSVGDGAAAAEVAKLSNKARDQADRWRAGFLTTLRETHLPEADWMLNALEARRQRQNLSGGSNFPFDTVGEARKILEERELEREQTETEKERRIKEFWRDQGKSEEEIRALWEKRKIRGKQIPDRTEQTESHTPLRLTGTTVAREKALDIAKRWEEGIRSTLTGASILDTDELVKELQRRREEQIKAGGDRFPFDIVGEARRILEEKSKEEEKNRAVPIGELTPLDDQAEKEKRIIEFWKGSGYSQEKIEDLLEKRRKRIPDRSKQTESYTPLRLTGTTVAQDRALDAANRWEEGLRSILGSAKLPLFPELLARLEQRRLELIGSDQDRFRIDWAQEARKILGEIEKSKGVLYLQEDASRNIDWTRGDERRLVVVTNDGKEVPAAVLGKNSDGNPILYMERAINNGRRFFSPHDTPKDSEFNIENSDYVIRGKVLDILANKQNQQFADSVKLEITLHHR